MLEFVNKYVIPDSNKSGGAVVLGTTALAAKAIPLAKTAIHTVASDHLYRYV